jgi:hypothetical protein
MLAMPVALGDDRRHVAALERGQDGPVFLVQRATLLGRQHPGRAVRLGAVPDVFDEPHQPRHPARGEERAVESVAVRAVPVRITGGQGAAGGVERGRGRGPVGLGRPAQAPAQRLSLQHGADGVDLDRVRRAEHRDHVAGVRRVQDQALTFENLQRLADRDPGHPIPGGQFVQPDGGAGQQLTVLDGAAEFLQHDLLGCGRALEPGHRHPHGRGTPGCPSWPDHAVRQGCG